MAIQLSLVSLPHTTKTNERSLRIYARKNGVIWLWRSAAISSNYEEDTYGNAFDKITDVIIMKGSTPNNIANDGTYLYMFEEQMIGIGTTSTLYSIKQNIVVIKKSLVNIGEISIF
jgi:hypothetical protein